MEKFDLEKEIEIIQDYYTDNCLEIETKQFKKNIIELCKKYSLSLIEDVDLWLEISKYCHNNTENCPHDIGIKIAEIIKSKINKEIN